VLAPARERAEIEKRLSLTRTLRAAGEGDADASLAVLRLTGDQLTLEDETGQLFPAVTYPRGLDDYVRHLVGMGVAQGVRELDGEHGVSATAVDIELGKVQDGIAHPLPDRGAILTLDDRIYVRVRSRSFQRLYVHILNLGIGGEISLLTDFEPGGVELRRDDEFVLGRDELDGWKLTGQALLWPRGVTSGGQARLDELAVVVTTRPCDLRHLETGAPPPADRVIGTIGAGSARGGNQLAERLLQLRDGATRSVAKREGERDDYLLKRMSFFLEPLQRPLRPASPTPTSVSR
jgi:hypothetical protein